LGVWWAFSAAGFCAQTFDFNLTTSGTFVTEGTPPEDMQVLTYHDNVVATPFPFVSLVASHTVVFTTTPWTAENGLFSLQDSAGAVLFGVYSADVFPTSDPNVVTLKGPFTFTGGTGRYTDITGSGDFDALISFTTEEENTGVSTILWSGTATVIPEPSPLVLVGFGVAGLALWRRRSHGG